MEEGLYSAIYNFVLRDWLAGQAMQGASNFINMDEVQYEDSLKELAVTSYRIADAMLAERNKKITP
jgi:hypothetical protein